MIKGYIKRRKKIMPKSKIKSNTLYLPTERVYREVTNKDGSKSRRPEGRKLKLDVLTEDIVKCEAGR